MPEAGESVVTNTGSPRIDKILIPPKTEQNLQQKFRVEGKLPSKRYEIKPTNDWNEIHKWDEAHKIKTNQGEIPLSDYLLKNARELTQLAYDSKFVTDEDLKTKIPFVDKKGTQYKDDKTGPVFEEPYSFLIDRKTGKFKIPDTLNAKQIQDLMILVFDKTVNTQDYKDRRNQEGLKDVFIETITEQYTNFKSAGSVDKKAATPSTKFTEEPIMQALNIACRKAVESRLKEDAYSLTKNYERPGEDAVTRLQNRLKIAAGIEDISQGETSEKQITEMMNVHREGSVKLESSVQNDLLMAQAFDILVPAVDRKKMIEDQMKIDSTGDYKTKASLQKELAKKKQMWRMAMLRHFNVVRNIPGSTIPSIAAEINNQTIFKRSEQTFIDGEMTKKIANQIVEIDRVRKEQGGFDGLNLSSANMLKARQLLETILPDPDAGKGRQKKDAKTIRTEKAQAIENKLTRLLAHSSEFVDYKSSQFEKGEAELKRSEYIKKSGLLTNLSAEDRALVEKILTDSFMTQVSMEKRLIKMSEDEQGSISLKDVKFANNINPAVKGVDLLYRRGVTEVLPDGERYLAKNVLGIPNYEIVYDKYDIPHIKVKNAQVEEVVSGAESSMSQKTGEVLPTEPESTPAPSKPRKTETDLATEVERNQWAEDISRIIGLEDEIHDLKSLGIALNKDIRFKVTNRREGVATSANFDLDLIEVKNMKDLETVAKMSEYLKGVQIQIDSLNYSTQEGQTTESTLNGFNIATLTLESKDTETITLRTENTEINNINLMRGNCAIFIDKLPIKVNSKSEGSRIILVTNTEDGLNNAISNSLEDSEKHFQAEISEVSNLTIGVKGINDSFIGNNDAGQGVLLGIVKRKIDNKPSIVNLNTYQFPEAEKTQADKTQVLKIETIQRKERVELLKTELASKKRSTEKKRLIGNIISEMKAGGSDVAELETVFNSLPNSGTNLKNSAKLTELSREIQNLKFPDKQEKPKSVTKLNEIKRLDEQAVELGRILKLKKVTDLNSLKDQLALSDYLKGGENPSLEIPNLIINSAADLDILSLLSDVDPELRIQIGTLNVAIREEVNTESSLSDITVDNLILSRGRTGESVSEIKLISTFVRNVIIPQGDFIINSDHHVPFRIDMSSSEQKKLNLVVQSDNLVDRLTTEQNLLSVVGAGTEFNLSASDNTVIEILLEDNALRTTLRPAEFIYSNVTQGDGWSSAEQVIGENYLVLEKGIYKLKPLNTGSNQSAKSTSVQPASDDQGTVVSTANAVPSDMPKAEDDIPTFLRNRVQASADVDERNRQLRERLPKKAVQEEVPSQPLTEESASAASLGDVENMASSRPVADFQEPPEEKLDEKPGKLQSLLNTLKVKGAGAVQSVESFVEGKRKGRQAAKVKQQETETALHEKFGEQEVVENANLASIQGDQPEIAGMTPEGLLRKNQNLLRHMSRSEAPIQVQRDLIVDMFSEYKNQVGLLEQSVEQALKRLTGQSEESLRGNPVDLQFLREKALILQFPEKDEEIPDYQFNQSGKVESSDAPPDPTKSGFGANRLNDE